jgi:hypothetical protein
MKRYKVREVIDKDRNNINILRYGNDCGKCTMV